MAKIFSYVAENIREPVNDDLLNCDQAFFVCLFVLCVFAFNKRKGENLNAG